MPGDVDLKDTEVLVSVIMPCKDAARFIESAIRSVLNQSHRQLQLIVVDDGSTDQSVSIVESFVAQDQRVTLHTRVSNSGGPATPRNIGVAKAQGEFIGFIDADDIWVPQKIAVQLAVMRQNKLNFCATLHRHFSDEKALLSTPELNLNEQARLERPLIRRINHAVLLRKNCIVTSSTLLHASLLAYLTFSEEAYYVAIEDYVAWLHLHQLPQIQSAIINVPLVFYRTRNDSISSSKIDMTQKIYKLLSVYEVQGKPLGLMRFYFFTTYLVGGVKSVISGWLNRVSD